MKKYITLTALLAAGSSLFAAPVATPVERDTTIDDTVNADTRLDFKYSTNRNQSVTTNSDTVTILGTDGYGLNTANATLTFNIQYQLNITGTTKLPTATTSSTIIKTLLNTTELSDLTDGESINRTVLTTDYIASFSPERVSLSIDNIQDLNISEGGWIFGYNNSGSWTYYSKESTTISGGGYVTINPNANAIQLEKGMCYSLAEIHGTQGASVKGIGFIASASPIPEPSAFGLLAGLGAIALVGTRRRRK
ncbi:MAG: PEP-CTERM sorting domain-containing protein [Opitutales bacterium]|nr:PEP-CTERM sorting domain-containing protein [Opitutales bacterium]